MCKACSKDLKSFSKLREKLIQNQKELEKLINEKIFIEHIKVEPDEYYSDINEVHLNNSFIFKTDEDQSPKLELKKKKSHGQKLVCPQCGITTHCLKDHIKKQHMNIKRFFCDNCEYKSYSRGAIKTHMAKHSRSEFHCDMCAGKSFARKNTLISHMNNFHCNEGPLTCCFCQKKCKNKTALWQHRKIHSDLIKNVKQKCEICKKEILIIYMKKHIQKIHETKKKDDEKQLCLVCGKIFSKKNFWFHERYHKERNFVCKFTGCTKKFITENHLVEHSKTHINQREHKCLIPGCNKSYFKQRLLRMHVALTHENFKEKCPVSTCNFSVGRKDYMRNHVAKHTELRKELVENLLESVKKNSNLW